MSLLLPSTFDPRLSAIVDLIASLPQLADPRDALEDLAATLRSGSGQRAILRLSTAGLPAGQCCILSQRETAKAPPPHPPLSPIVIASSFLSSLLRTPWPKLIHHLDPRTSDLPGSLALYQSAIAAPLFVDGQASDWVLVLDSHPEAFGVEDLEELILRTALVVGAMNNLQVTRQLFDSNLQANKEIDQIAGLQRALLPAEIPKIPGLEIAAFYSPTVTAGGDMYDFIPLAAPHPPETLVSVLLSSVGFKGLRRAAPAETTDAAPAEEKHPWAILIADVAGHGPAAAVVMAMVHSILHAYPVAPTGPGQLLAHVNHHLCCKQIGRTFVTAFLGFYDPASKELRYARAGHNPPLLFDPAADRIARLDEAGDMPLGIMPDASFQEATVKLASNQTLLLYTDGLTESPNPEGQFFEVAGLEKILREHAAAPPEELLNSLHSAIQLHQAFAPQLDDQTAVAIRVA